MHWIRFTFLTVLAMLLQASFVHALAFDKGHISPHLLLIVLTYIALYADGNDVIIASFFLGLAADTIGTTIGPYTLAYGLSGTAMVELRRYLLVDKWVHQALAIFLLSLMVGTMSRLLFIIKGPAPAQSLASVLFWMPLYSAILGPLIFRLLHYSLGIHRPRRHLGYS